MKLIRQLGPGVWEDEAGVVHVHIPEVLAHLKIPDTPENRDKLTSMTADMLSQMLPQSKVEVSP